MRFTAPGKILLLGGYSVLDGYPALSIAVEDRKGLGVTAECSDGGFRIVSEEFFIDRRIEPDGKLADCRDSASCAFMSALAYLQGKGIGLKPVTVSTQNSLIFGTSKEKSGLGSSAASTVAIAAAVLGWHGIEDRDITHKVSQIANFLATEKTGAGFDVACSVFGTIRYKRFDRKALSLRGGFGAGGTASGISSSRNVAALAEKDWPGMEVKPFSMGGYTLLAFNIRGSKTGTVEAIRAMGMLRKSKPGTYARMIARQADAEGLVFDGIAASDDAAVRKGMRMARDAQRKLSAEVEGLAGSDPIEPEELTSVIEKAEKLGGVIAGRCPGAGGYDSLAFLVDAENGADSIAGRIVQIGKDAGVRLARIGLRLASGGVRRLA